MYKNAFKTGYTYWSNKFISCPKTMLKRALTSSNDSVCCFSWLPRRLNPFTCKKLACELSPALRKNSPRTCERERERERERLYMYCSDYFPLTLTTAVLTSIDGLSAITTILSWSSIGPSTLRTWVSGNKQMTFLMWDNRPVSMLTGTVSGMSFSLRKGSPRGRE